jgi:hypothetical protein
MYKLSLVMLLVMSGFACASDQRGMEVDTVAEEFNDQEAQVTQVQVAQMVFNYHIENYARGDFSGFYESSQLKQLKNTKNRVMRYRPQHIPQQSARSLNFND